MNQNRATMGFGNLSKNKQDFSRSVSKKRIQNHEERSSLLFQYQVDWSLKKEKSKRTYVDHATAEKYLLTIH